MKMTAALAGLMLQPAGAATPTPPAFGVDVASKSAETRAMEQSDPVAARCAAIADALAVKVRGEVGDVAIRQDPGGTIWHATLLMAREPPLVPKITCDARTFTIANDSFDVSTPPDRIAWPYCGWGLSKAARAGVRCTP